MLSERYLRRRDQLIEDLDLTRCECKFVEQQHCGNTAARRVALLIGQFVEASTRSERESLLRILIEDAVPLLRRAMAVAALQVPDGYSVIADQHLRALQAAAEQGLVVSSTAGAERDHAIGRLKQRLEVVVNLDSSVAVFMTEMARKEGARG